MHRNYLRAQKLINRHQRLFDAKQRLWLVERRLNKLGWKIPNLQERASEKDMVYESRLIENSIEMMKILDQVLDATAWIEDRRDYVNDHRDSDFSSAEEDAVIEADNDALLKLWAALNYP